VSKEYWRLLEVGESIQRGDEWLNISPPGPRWELTRISGTIDVEDVYRRRITVPDWPTPIAFADEKPKEGQKILYWVPPATAWMVGIYNSKWNWGNVTHWLPAPPDLPEPKPAWEVAWEDYGTTGPILIAKTDFKAIWDRAQKEKV
jgi:hypothetical protein